MNILLINPPSIPYEEVEGILNKTSDLRVPTLAMPVGLMDLAAFVRERCNILNIKILEISREFTDFFHNREESEAISYEEFIKINLEKVDFDPDIVGISLMFSCSRKSTIQIATLSKDKWRHCKTIVGGNTATSMYKNLLENESIDYVARGEAEYSFVSFVSYLGDGGGTDFNIQGIFDKDKAQTQQTDLCPFVDVNKSPFPAFDLIDLNWYLNSPKWYGRSYGASVMFSRGCPFKCTFCGAHVVHGRKVRHKSNEQCLKEVKYLLDKGFRHIKPEDDIWAIDKKKFLQLAAEISKIKGDCRFELSGGLSVNVMDEERVDSLLRMGVTKCQLAIESGSPFVQKHIIKKHVNLKKVKKLLDYMRKVGFNAEVNFILGFPGETVEMMKESIEFMKTLDVNWVWIFNCQPIPGSDLYEEFKKIVDLERIDWDKMRMARRVFDTTQISARELETTVYDVNIDVNFFENSNMHNRRYDLAIEYWNDMIITPYPFHIVGRYCRSIAYFRLDRKIEALRELEDCIQWIGKNKESKRLYERYKKKMPLLNNAMEKGDLSIDEFDKYY